MNKPECELLDAYLLGWLSEPDAATFESHLAACPECARQKAMQARIDNAAEAARSQPEPAAPLLVARIHRRVRTARAWRFVRIASGLAAATLLAVVLGKSWFAAKRAGVETETKLVAQSDEAPQAIAAAVAQPQVRMADPASAILVPMPSKNPDVAIVWVYPTWKAGDGVGGGVHGQ